MAIIKRKCAECPRMVMGSEGARCVACTLRQRHIERHKEMFGDYPIADDMEREYCIGEYYRRTGQA